jgi:hypothetical protein
MARRFFLVSEISYGNTLDIEIGEKLKNFLLSALLMYNLVFLLFSSTEAIFQQTKQPCWRS